jgi:hypothetical protein
MNKKFILGILSILTVMASVFFINTASAEKSSAAESEAFLSTTLVISQVYSGGGGAGSTYLNDYVELKNISATPQSLNGLSLVYASATGQFASVATNAFALPNVTLAPGRYYLVQLGTAGAGGVPVPSPDATTTNLNMAAASGKVALVTSAFMNNTCGATATPCPLPSASIIDLVSWGASNNAEGGATVNNGTALTATQGAVRKGNGCTETDNNNNDFDVITAPVPRNSTTAPAPCGAAPTSDAPVDFNGDGRTDWVVVRNTGGGVNGQLTWFWNINNAATPTAASAWGLNNDILVPADYDGDQKDDIAVWRPGAATTAAFYILNSATNTARVEAFGQSNDNPTVVNDYNGDGKDDVAVWRPGNPTSTWFYRTTPGGAVNYIPWGGPSDFVAPGDWNGDGTADFGVGRVESGSIRWWIRTSTGTTNAANVFGSSLDFIITGDFDGDAKTDLATVRFGGGVYTWYWRPSAGGADQQVTFGFNTDTLAPGDYDGDGKTDIAVFRNGVFYVRSTTSGAVSYFTLGTAGDRVPAFYNAH